MSMSQAVSLLCCCFFGRQRFSLEKEVQDVGVVGRAEEGATEQTPT